MSMDLKYVNHKGAVLDLSDWPYVLQSDHLFDYEWQYNEINTGKRGGVISSFYKDARTTDATICIHSMDDTEFESAMNRFFEVVEADIAAKIPGRLVLPDGYYLICYIVASSDEGWRRGIRTDMKRVKLVSEYPWWCLDVLYRFEPGMSGIDENYEFLDFPIDFPLDFSNAGSAKVVFNNSIESAMFKMIMYGPAVNPYTRIGKALYRVDIELKQSEWLIIDSRDRTVMHHKAAGFSVPVFNSREKAEGVFQPIPNGMNRVQETNCYFDLTVYEGRSVPKWIL